LYFFDVGGNSSTDTGTHPAGSGTPSAGSNFQAVDRLGRENLVADNAKLQTHSLPQSDQSRNRIDALALSGGGMRAAFYHLGVLAYLALANELKSLKLIVSVSGGSILSGHFLMNWPRASSDLSGFESVAQEFIKFSATNIRNCVLVPWLWSRPLLFTWFRWQFGRTRRLVDQYEKHYGQIRFDDFLEIPGLPQAAIAANDSRRQERVVFTNSEILRYNFGGALLSKIQGRGTKLALAVAASSCFPPVFDRMRVTYNDFGLNYGEFQDALYLNDGGVTGNLGIEVLCSLLKPDSLSEHGLVLASDAERPQTTKPGNSPKADTDAQGIALSDAARTKLSSTYGDKAKLLSFSQRLPRAASVLPFDVQTTLSGYRTDLDSPTWQEIHALMLHGACVCSHSLDSAGFQHKLSHQDLTDFIGRILVSAGAPSPIPQPTSTDLRTCSRRPSGGLLWHILGVFACLLIELGLLIWLLSWLWPKKPPELPELSLDEPISYRLLPDPTAEPGFPSPAQVTAAAERPLVGTVIRYRNLSNHNVRLLIYDCVQHYQDKAATKEPFVHSCFSEWPVQASTSSTTDYLRFSRFKQSQNWFGFYSCDLVTHKVRLLGFYDLTTHHAWRIELSGTKGAVSGEVYYE
jgi:predicted acylesterase/phospholipase RssA